MEEVFTNQSLYRHGGESKFSEKNDFHRELFLTINRFPEANMKVFSDNQKRLCIFSLEEVIKIS